MKKLFSLFLAALIAIAPLQEAHSQYLTPVTGTTYDHAVHNIPLVAKYNFGSSATQPSGCIAGTHCTALTNASQLATVFDPLNINAQSTTINSELENYTTSFSGSLNHVFNTTDLQLTATLDAGGSVTPVVYGNLGNNPGITVASFPASAVGLSDVSALVPGQSFIFTYFGHYAIASVTGSGGTATITLTRLFGSPTTIPAGVFTPWAVLPWYFQATNAPTAVGNVMGVNNILHFASTPSWVANGQIIRLYNNTNNTNQFNNAINSNQTYVVTAHDGTSVTLDKTLVGSNSVATGQIISFLQPIRSGQIWTKDFYNMPGWGGKTYFAMKMRAKLPFSAPYAASGSISGATANAMYGNWPAFWFFGANNCPAFSNAAEIDMLEEYGNILRDAHNIDPNLHQGASATLPAGVTDYLYNPSSWTLAGSLYTYNSSIDYSQAFHDYALEVTPDAVYYFIDNVMMKKTNYHWTSSCPATIGMNLAVGSFAAGLGTNMLLPVANTNFPQTYNIQSFEVRSK